MNMLLDTMLLFAMVGVGAAAVVAVAWRLVTSGHNEISDAGGPNVEARAAHAARTQRGDDPIVAALGLSGSNAGPAVELEGRLPGRDEGVDL